MNIFGIGIDIIEINRIENVLERTPRFLERNFTEKEWIQRNSDRTCRGCICRGIGGHVD